MERWEANGESDTGQMAAVIQTIGWFTSSRLINADEFIEAAQADPPPMQRIGPLKQWRDDKRSCRNVSP